MGQLFEQTRVNGALRRTDNPPPGSSGILIRFPLTEEQAAAYLKKVDLEQYMEAYSKTLEVSDFKSISGTIWAQGWLTTEAARNLRDVKFPILCNINARLTAVSEAKLTNRDNVDFSRYTFDFTIDTITNSKPYDAAEDAMDGEIAVRVRQPRLNQGVRLHAGMQGGAGIGAGLVDPVAVANAQRAAQVLGHQSSGAASGF